MNTAATHSDKPQFHRPSSFQEQKVRFYRVPNCSFQMEHHSNSKSGDLADIFERCRKDNMADRFPSLQLSKLLMSYLRLYLTVIPALYLQIFVDVILLCDLTGKVPPFSNLTPSGHLRGTESSTFVFKKTLFQFWFQVHCPKCLAISINKQEILTSPPSEFRLFHLLRMFC